MVEVGDTELVGVDHGSGNLDHGGLPLQQAVITRKNVGAYLDRIVHLLPPGAAREFVRELPRRVDRDQLFANLEALVRLLQVSERR